MDVPWIDEERMGKKGKRSEQVSHVKLSGCDKQGTHRLLIAEQMCKRRWTTVSTIVNAVEGRISLTLLHPVA